MPTIHHHYCHSKSYILAIGLVLDKGHLQSIFWVPGPALGFSDWSLSASLAVTVTTQPQLGASAQPPQPLNLLILNLCPQNLSSCGPTLPHPDPRVQTLKTQSQLTCTRQHHSFQPSCPHTRHWLNLCPQPQPGSRQKAQEAFRGLEVRSTVPY